MHVLLIAAVLGLVATGCDIALTRREELLYMWKKPLRITFVRCLFVVTRYLSVAIHIIDVIFASMWTNGTEQVPAEKYCMRILIFQFLACYSMVMLLEVVLMLRVFALYERSRAIGIFLLFLLISRSAGSIYAMQERVLRFDAVEIKFTSHCLPAFTFKHALSNPVVVFIYGEVTIQLLILALVMKRTVWDLRQYSHSLFSVLNRDGLVVFGAMGVAMIAIGVGSAKKGAATVFIFPLFISLISAAGCHTILNLQKLGLADTDTNTSEQKKDLELTTFDNMDFTTWDERTFSTVDHLPSALENEFVTSMHEPPCSSRDMCTDGTSESYRHRRTPSPPVGETEFHTLGYARGCPTPKPIKYACLMRKRFQSKIHKQDIVATWTELMLLQYEEIDEFFGI
ncbi:hypothetical protein BDP27DRAFT_1404516 [Rhodocollybia butyracea]|uniref:DUF6533 domain-containing protein n=1 Tax=Rhodocollybia butyracea TaxID=206335 RepID=A0A9P5U4Y9_9AGAR|nr:hypothetical protein BDP27DRAFT_1404516 [Rhodocollybia butyracea]